MSDAKARDLYANLGLAGQQVSQREIRDAYKKLALKSHPDKNLGGDSGGTVEFVKARPHLLFTLLLRLFHVQSAYEILGDPEKRAKYDHSYSRFQHHAKTKSKHKYKPGYQPSSEELRSGWEQKQETMQQRTEALRREHAAQQAQQLADQDFKDEWNRHVDQMFDYIKRSNKDARRRENEAFAEREVDEAAQLREEKAGCERAAAEQALAEDINFITKEAKESILILAGVEKRPKNLSLREYIKQWEDDGIQRLVQRTNGLLDYLWTKSVAGGWICPEIKDAVKLDQLVGLVLRGTWGDSNFPPETRSRAASLLNIWREKKWGATEEGPHTSFAQGATHQQQHFDFMSSTGGQWAGSSFQYHWESQRISRDAAHKDAYFEESTQCGINVEARVLFAGQKRSRPLSPDEEQEDQRAKKQKHFNLF